MIRIGKTDPQTYENGVYVLDTTGVNKDEQLMLYNDSPAGCHLDFEDGSKGVLPAYWNKDFIMQQPMGKVTITVDYLLINPAQYPISLLYGELYEKEERVASVNASINRGIVVTGGAVATTQGQTLINEGNAPGSVVERFSSSANLNDTTTVTNDGLYTLYVTIATALVQFLKSNATDPILQLGAATHLVEILGKLNIDSDLTVTGITSLQNTNIANGLNVASGGISATGGINIPSGGMSSTGGIVSGGPDTLGAIGVLTHILGTLTVDQAATLASLTVSGNSTIHAAAINTITPGSGSDFVVNPASGHKVNFEIAGVSELTIDSVNLTAVGVDIRLSGTQHFQFLSGSASRQQGGHVALATATVTHGMGNTPAFVLITTDIAQPGSATIGCGNLGATTFDGHIGAGTAFWWMCLSG